MTDRHRKREVLSAIALQPDVQDMTEKEAELRKYTGIC